MALISSQRIVEAGIVPTMTNIEASNTFVNNGYQFLYYKNTSGVTKTITVTAQVTSIRSPLYGDITKGDAVKVVANGEDCMIGPFSVEAYNDDDGLATFAITPFNEADEVGLLFL